MFVTSSEVRGGLLVAVISGGRPALRARPTARFLPALEGFGAEIVWVVSEDDAPGYERDRHPLAVYPRDWQRDYATSHWMLPEPPAPGGFLGAFPGREWACLEAERRGCWGVLQIDDNLSRLCVPRGGKAAIATARLNGGLAFYADILAGITLSTNGRLVGANLDATPKAFPVVAHVGFPYSLFIERVGEGRENWFGPFEDDITHAFQYGTRADGATTLVVPPLRYCKESKSQTGMRAAYNHGRAVQLQRIFPERAKIGVRATRSNGKGAPRVFHTMLGGAIRNPMVVTDTALFRQVRERMQNVMVEWHRLARECNQAKITKRTTV